MRNITVALSLLTAVSAFAQTEIKTTVFGDVRIRYESIEAEGATGKDNYDHMRLRARLGAKSLINETLSSEFRIATGPGGTTTNQTLGSGAAAGTNNGAKNYDFNLDRAYLKYTPDERTVVSAGRTSNPYVLVGDNSMLFDADLNFDGASISYAYKTDHAQYQLILAHTILAESSGSVPNQDVKLNSAELAIRFGGDVNSFLVTLTEHSFNGLKDSGVIGSASGNSLNGTTYRYDYDVSSVGLEYGYKGLSVPLTFFAEVAKNNHTSREDMASIYGVKVNTVKKKGDWMISVDSRELESDSTLGSLADGESAGGGTDGRSLNTSVTYGLGDTSNVVASYFAGKTGIAPNGADLDRNRVQIDLNVRF